MDGNPSRLPYQRGTMSNLQGEGVLRAFINGCEYMKNCVCTERQVAMQRSDILPPPMLTHRGGGFSFDSTNVLSISELTPCVPRFSRITFHSYLGHFTHRRKLGFRIFGFSVQPYISSCQCTCQYIYYILFIFIRQQKIYIFYADKKRRNSSPAYRGGG